jgi:hypothetical protein
MNSGLTIINLKSHNKIKSKTITWVRRMYGTLEEKRSLKEIQAKDSNRSTGLQLLSPSKNRMSFEWMMST